MNPLLTGKELRLILSNHYHTKPIFIGVYPDDIFPDVTNIDPPFCIILNSDPHNKLGEHWSVVFRNDEYSTSYFCSLGRAPTPNATAFIKSMGGLYYANMRRFQPLNSVRCGNYCLYYCDLKAQSFSDSDIYKTFSTDDYKTNDDLVTAYTYFHMLKK